ncbi:MAG: hypothetical protein AseanaTS_12920 [Candidatus Pelagadaptatus aseana]|uniref:chemotaxis protein CheX n=1 Tax=Candidatus Pelagadaptatus aseana TaxID=3120508 RepID=UPI0039B14103
MNTEAIIAINLGIFLVAAIIIGIGTYRQELKYRNRLKKLVHDLKDRLDEALQRNRELEGRLTNSASTASEPEQKHDVSREAGMNHALNSLRQQLQMRDQKIKLLEEYSSRAPGDDDKQLLGAIVDDLRQELDSSRAHVESLERDVADTSILRSRVSQLSKEEGRHRSIANTLRQKLDEARSRLSEVLHLSKRSERLQEDNQRLGDRVDELSSKAVHLTAERDSLSAMYNELSNKESYQRKQIEMLEQQLESAYTPQEQNEPVTDSELQARVEELEAELDEVRNELERTLKEKTMVETHMISMDKAASKLDQREEELQRLKKEHETLEMHFLMDQEQRETSASSTAGADKAVGDSGELDFEALEQAIKQDNVEFVGQRVGSPKQQNIEVIEKSPNKLKNTDAYDSPLFSSISEFWEKFIDANEEVAIISTAVPNKPSRLSLWTYVWIGDEDLGIILGLDRDLSERVTAVLFDKEEANLQEDEVVDSVGEMTNIVAGFVANNLGDSRKLSAPKHIQREELDQLMFYMKTSAEILVGTQSGRLYLGTIEKNL